MNYLNCALLNHEIIKKLYYHTDKNSIENNIKDLTNNSE